MSLLETLGLNVLSSFIYESIKKAKYHKRKSEKSKITERLKLLLKLMNEGREKKFTISKFSKILKLKKISDLEKYFVGEDEPTFKFLKKLSKEFGINIEWLAEGKGYPFKSDRDTYINLYEDVLKKIEELKPFVVYFVRAESVRGETCILLEIEDYKLIILDIFVHFSGKNGSGGQRQLVELRRLIMYLILEKKMITKSLVVPKGIFFKLFNGEIHPSVAIQKRIGTFQHWHDDFTDIYNQRHGYQYQDEYDHNFFDAFNLVKSYVEKNGEI